MSDEKKTPPPNLNEMLEDARAELEASAHEEQFLRRITRERIGELSDIMVEHFKPLEPLLGKEFSEERVEESHAQRAGLIERSWVSYAAIVQVHELFGDTLANELDELTVRVAEADAKLIGWARPLFDHDPKLTAVIDDIAKGTGRRDSAEDVLRLAKLYRNDWKRIASMNIIDDEQLGAAEADASRMLELLKGKVGNPTRELSALAYSAWHRDYKQLRRVARYLCGDEPDFAARFPGMVMPTRPKQPEKSAQVEQAEQPEAGANDTPPEPTA